MGWGKNGLESKRQREERRSTGSVVFGTISGGVRLRTETCPSNLGPPESPLCERIWAQLGAFVFALASDGSVGEFRVCWARSNPSIP